MTDQLGFVAVLRRLRTTGAFVLAKPEAVVGRRIERILSFLAARGYQLADLRAVRLSHGDIRTLWRRQLGVAPSPLVRLVELSARAGPYLLISVVHPGTVARPACIQLSRRKGSAVPDAGSSQTLRGVVGVSTPALSFVHTPDGPAELLRELSLLLGPEQVAEVARRTVDPRRVRWPAGRAEAIVATEYDRTEPHDLEPTRSAERLTAASAGTSLARLVRHAITALAGGTGSSPVDRWAICDALIGAETLPCWDRITVSAHLIGDLRTGRSPTGGHGATVLATPGKLPRRTDGDAY